MFYQGRIEKKTMINNDENKKTRTTITQLIASHTPSTLSKTTLQYLLTFYPNTCRPYPPTQGYILGNLNLRHIFGLPLPVLVPTITNFSHLLASESMHEFPLHVSKPSSYRFPHLVHHNIQQRKFKIVKYQQLLVYNLLMNIIYIIFIQSIWIL